MNLYQIRSLLEDKNIIEPTNKGSYLVKCPFHNEQKGTALYISFLKNKFKCYSGKCIPKNVHGDLLKLCSMLGFLQHKIQINIPKFFKEKIVKEQKELQIFDLNNFQKFHTNDYRYLFDRGLSKEICKENQCSYSDYAKRFYIPLWYEKQCYGIIGRTILSEKYYSDLLIQLANYLNESVKIAEKKLENGYFDNIEEFTYLKQWKPHIRYLNSFQLPKDSLIFEPLSNSRKSEFTMITEGQIKTLKCNEFGDNSVATIASYPTKLQIEKVMQNCKKTNSIPVLAYDNDEAGENNKNLFRKLYGNLILSFNWKLIKRQVKDIDNLTFQEYCYLKKNLTYF